MTSDRKERFISGALVLWIVLPLIVLGLWISLDHANANQDRALKASNQQFRHALFVTDRKFQIALHVQTRLFAYSMNKSVCTLRPFLQTARKARLAAIKSAKDDADRDLNQQAADSYKRLIDSQVTVPSTFDCSTLPKTPPKGTP